MARGAAFGVLFASGFGFLWVNWAAALLGAAHANAWRASAAAIALFLATCSLLVLRRSAAIARPSGERRRISRVFGAVNAVQWAAIIIAGVLLFRTHHEEWFPWTVSVVVGLHFFPLAPLFGRRMVVLGALVLAVDGAALYWKGLERAGIAALGTGCILLGFASLAVPFLLRSLKLDTA